MLAAGILSFCLVGIMKLFICTAAQASLAGSKTLAVSQAQNKIEEIRDRAFENITAAYGTGGTPGPTFTLDRLEGVGTVDIDAANAELLRIKVSVFWRDKYGRIIGEDANLNGMLDSGEDVNGNGALDSPVTVMSMITRR